MRRRFDLTPLGHPVWWGALALLVINDHFLKGSGVVPGWLTGKFSDFAFLIVAPVLLAALIPCRVPRRRTFAAVAVVAVYVAADLSPAVSEAIVALAARAGLTSRLWPDPTDLVALAVLPVTIWLLRPAPRRAAAAGPARGQRERAAVVLGALACLATTNTVGDGHNPFLVNRTTSAVDVRITWVLRQTDCEMTPEALEPLLTPGDLDDPRPMTMASGDVAALDGPPPAGASAVGSCTNVKHRILTSEEDCVAAILETDGANPVLMVTRTWWQDGADFPCAPHLAPQQSPGRDALSIVDSGGARRFELAGSGPGGQLPTGSPIRIAPIDPAAIAARPAPADSCRATYDAYQALVSMRSCARDGDCQVIPGLAIPGAACSVYVNTSAEGQGLETQWHTALCRRSDDACFRGGGALAACIEATCRPANWQPGDPP